VLTREIPNLLGGGIGWYSVVQCGTVQYFHNGVKLPQYIVPLFQDSNITLFGSIWWYSGILIQRLRGISSMRHQTECQEHIFRIYQQMRKEIF
jgi:hypothetical protein